LESVYIHRKRKRKRKREGVVVRRLSPTPTSPSPAAAFYGRSDPARINAARYTALTAHAARREALPPFREFMQPLSPPGG
jgi:hypothetical protein